MGDSLETMVCRVLIFIHHALYTLCHIPYTIQYVPYAISYIPYTIYSIAYTTYNVLYTLYHIPHITYDLPCPLATTLWNPFKDPFFLGFSSGYDQMREELLTSPIARLLFRCGDAQAGADAAAGAARQLFGVYCIVGFPIYGPSVSKIHQCFAFHLPT